MKKSTLYEKIDNNTIKCLACANNCLIKNEDFGFCKVRKNIDEELFLLVYARPISYGIDPIEKKPLFHYLPNTKTFSLGTMGCNFKCIWCQNSQISQIENPIDFENQLNEEIEPEEIVKLALDNNCKSISYTYNEPTIFIEYIRDIARLAKKQGLKNILVTNGYLTKESFDYLNSEDLIDALNIDLKSFSDDFYINYCKAFKGVKPVLETIKRAYQQGIHIEITTLIIPSLNDSSEELTSIAKFISNIDKNIVWHINRFFPRYKLMNKIPTPLKTLQEAKQIGKNYLNYVYIGNV